MGRRSSRGLVGDVAGALTSEPQSIQEISDAVGADRQAVTRYLEELRDAGIVKEEKSGRSRKFYVSKYEANETYFGLPLDDEQRQKFKLLFKKIYDEYRRQFGRTPGKLLSQKVAVKVISDLGLDLPFGRYQYGSITPMNYTPGDGNDVGPVDFGQDFTEEEIQDKVEETVEDFGTMGFEEARKKQYGDEDMELYLLKEGIMEALAGKIEERSDFEQELYRFLAKTPDLDGRVDEALVDFIAVSTDLLDEASHRAKVIEAFQDFWELIAFYCLKEDLSEYYPDKTLEDKMSRDREEKWDEVEEVMTELISLHEKVKDFEVSEEMEDIGAGKIPEEEQEKREEELEDMDASDVAREFDLES